MRVLIVGGGIGGLTLAIALARRGMAVQVIERAASQAPAGAGLALQPNAMVVLASLGLADAVVAEGQPVDRAAIVDWEGRALGGELDMRALGASVGAPVVAIHRARLHAVLHRAAIDVAIERGVEAIAVEDAGTEPAVRCGDGRVLQADVVVGADGLRSVVRHHIVGDAEPVYSGYTSWRGVTTAGDGPTLSRMTEAWGAGERFGMVAIGHGEIYWFAVADAPRGGTDGDAKGALLARFGHWHEPTRAVIEATDPHHIIRTDISDRDPVRRWHRGRLVLLGDAAHPMTPNLGQGACQAIEDAEVLAEALSSGGDLESALGCYEARRVARANRIVLAARRFGQVSQWRHPLAVWFRNTATRLTPAGVAARQVQALWRV